LSNIIFEIEFRFLSCLGFLLDVILDAQARVPAIGVSDHRQNAPVCDLAAILCKTLVFSIATLNRRAAGKRLP